MSTFSPHVARLLSRIAFAQILIVVFAILVLASVPMFILVFSGVDDVTSSSVSGIVRSLWPLVAIPALGLCVCWRWRATLRRKLRESDTHAHRTA